jgi:hypothetical protein
MWPINLLSNKIFQILNPKIAVRGFVDLLKLWGINIDQNKTLADFNLGNNVKATGQTIVRFLAPNFSFPDSEHFLITGIRVLSGTGTVDVDRQLYTPGIATDGDVQAGLLSINNNGSTVLKEIPLSSFSTGTNLANGGYLELSNPILWVGQTNLQAEVSFDNAPATVDYNLRLELIGQKLI